MEKKQRNYPRRYVVNTYLLFWIMIFGLGGLASTVFPDSQNLMTGVTVVCSWAPTIVVLLMMKKLRPGNPFS